MEAVGTQAVDAGIWLPAMPFAVDSTHSGPSVLPGSQRKLLRNKTVRLEILEGAEADGD
jgi:hypothetical protein